MDLQKRFWKKNFRKVLGVGFLASNLLSTACVVPEDAELIDDLFNPPPADEVPAPPVDAGCFHQRFVQPEGEVTKKVDILFVVDTSGSLNQEREDIANGIDSFIEALPADADFRLAMMLAHGSHSALSGQLYQASDEPAVLDSSVSSIDDIRADFLEKMSHPPKDSPSDGGELGLFSFNNALTNNFAAIQAQGFFRDDAALAVVFVADENDICAEYPEGVTPVLDPSGRETSSFQEDCGGITAESVVNQVLAVKADMPVLLGGIIYSDLATVPSGGENEFGYGYMDAIELNSGIAVDLASGDYDEGLAELGLLTTIKIVTQTDFAIAEEQVDVETLEVNVDGVATPFEYIEETNMVHLDFAGGPQSTVDILYCTLEDDNRDKDGDGLDDETGEPLF